MWNSAGELPGTCDSYPAILHVGLTTFASQSATGWQTFGIIVILCGFHYVHEYRTHPWNQVQPHLFTLKGWTQLLQSSFPSLPIKNKILKL